MSELSLKMAAIITSLIFSTAFFAHYEHLITHWNAYFVLFVIFFQLEEEKVYAFSAKKN
jgi:hypothetical protein